MLALLIGCTGDALPETEAAAGLPDDFHIGVNYPWRSYGNDFGDNAWHVGGVAMHADEIDADFAAIAGAGVSVVRWFVLTDGRSGVTFDADGMPTALQPQVLDDFDVAVALAEDHGLVLVPSLLDFWWLAPAEVVSGVQLGGHAATVASADGRAAIVEHLFRPLLERHGRSPGIGAWEIINEPEWAIEGIGGGWLGESVSLAAMQDLVAQAAAAAQETSDHPVTVGSASVSDARLLWLDQGLDLIQVHSYDGVAQHTDATSLSQTLCIVGELGTAAAYGDLAENLDALKARGYDGVWLWSLRGEDTASALDLDAVADWIAAQ